MNGGRPIRVRIGSVGARGAGKTYWLFGLLRALRGENHVRLGRAAEEYYQRLESQARDGSFEPTEEATPRLEVTVPNDLIPGCLMPEMAPDRMITLEFIDGGGKDLFASRKCPPRRGRSKSVPLRRLIDRCDALLFFIDPVFSKNREKRDRHLARAEQRARVTVTEIVRRRANRYLPMVFILTRADRFDRLPNEEQDEIARWCECLFGILNQEYAPLRGYNPSSLLGPQESLFFPVFKGDDLPLIMEPLVRLLAVRTEARRFDRHHRIPASLILALAALAFVAVTFLFLPILSTHLPQSFRAAVSSLTKRRQADAPSRVPFFVRELQAIPDEADPRGEKYLLLAQAIGYFEASSPPDASLLNTAIAEAVHRLSEALCFPERSVDEQWRAARFFSGLTAAQLRRWDTEQVPYSVFLPAAIDEIARQRVTSQLVNLVEQSSQNATPPEETLRKVADFLRQEEQNIAKLNILGRGGVTAEMRAAGDFLRDRLEEDGYTVHLRFEVLERGEAADSRLAGHVLFPAAGKDDSLQVLKGAILPTGESAKPAEITRRLPIARELTFGLVPCYRLPDGRIECSDNPADFSDRVDFARFRGHSLEILGFPALLEGESRADDITLSDGTRLAMSVLPDSPIPALLWRIALSIQTGQTGSASHTDDLSSPGE